MGLFRTRHLNSTKEEDASSVEKNQAKPEMMMIHHDDHDDDDVVVVEDEDFGKSNNNNNSNPRRPRRNLLRLLRRGGRRSSNNNNNGRTPVEDFVNEDIGSVTDYGEVVKDVDDRAARPFVPPPPTVAPKGPSKFRPSHLQSKITELSNENTTTMIEPPPARVAALPPPAREAAFHGPPRFDWIDIEYTAATKIQSIQRRNKVMRDLEEKGLSTSAIRNRIRRRKVVRRSYFGGGGKGTSSPSSSSSLFNCCGVGLLFCDDGDYNTDDADAYREFERKKYEERVNQQQAHEDALRLKYMKDHNTIQGPAATMFEKVEVVD